METAARRAEEWIAENVFLVNRDEIKAPDAHLHDLPPVFFAWGDRSLLDRAAASILNSRKPRRPTPGDSWISVTKSLFRSASGRKHVIVSSFGTIPFALVSRMAAAGGLPLIVVFDDVLPFMKSRPEKADFFGVYGDLFRCDRTLLCSPFPPGRIPRAALRYSARDNLVAALSSHIMVAAVRKGGNMETLVKRASERSIRITVFTPERPDKSTAGNLSLLEGDSRGRIETAALTEYPLSTSGQPGTGDRSSTPRNGVLQLKNWPRKGSHLIHYTRSCHGPWPGQTMRDYCQSLIDGSPDAAHTGFDTLLRILGERLLRSSDKLTRGDVPVVSFTECLPAELAKLIKWRRGLVRWSFEPYGIAIRKDYLLDSGVRPVTYGDERIFNGLPEDQRHLFQSQTSTGTNWSAEKEWRSRGDVNLAGIPEDQPTIFVATPAEAWIIQNRFGYDVTLSGIEGDWHSRM